VPHQNATTVQVAISVVSAVRYMLKHPNEGFCLPDDIDEREILKVAKPYLGRFVSDQTEWNPLRSLDISYTAYGRARPPESEMWQYSTFSLGAGILS
jgi:homospermidine synthase